MAGVASARRYAQAVLQLALEQNSLDAWREDLDVLNTIWADSALRGYLEDVRLSKQKRLDRARETLGTRIRPLALNMVLLLLSRGRSHLIPYIARQFEELERQRKQTVVAHVTSAIALSEAQQADLKARLTRQTGKGVLIETAVKPDILGGLIIKVGDQLLDLSVAGKLRRMREQVVGRESGART